MKIDALFVLSAGAGLRMGKVGRVLPKPLWPIFEKTLLELQFTLYQYLDIEKKVINIHHQAHLVQNFIKEKYLDIQFLHERQLLDVGGAIINLKREYPDIKCALISNVDQFLFMNPENIKKEISELSTFDTIIFAIYVDRNQGYNKLDISKEGRLLGVNKSPQEDYYFTYSGVSLVNCASLPLECDQKVGFFQSVAHQDKKRVKVVPVNDCTYHDFGTEGLYLKEVTSLLEQIKKKKGTELFNFLKDSNAIQFEKINETLNSYNSVKSNECRFKDLTIHLNEVMSIELNGVVDVVNSSR